MCACLREQGHPEAIYNLGLMFAYGRGVGKDYQRAAMWFEQGCDQMNHGLSCMFLATMNIYGNGFDVDYDAALLWMKKALNTQDARATEVATKVHRVCACQRVCCTARRMLASRVGSV